MKLVRWLLMLVMAGAGCVTLPEAPPRGPLEETVQKLGKDSAEGVSSPAAGAEKAVAPVTPEQVTEQNAHEVLRQLQKELDREGGPGGTIKGP